MLITFLLYVEDSLPKGPLMTFVLYVTKHCFKFVPFLQMSIGLYGHFVDFWGKVGEVVSGDPLELLNKLFIGYMAQTL